MFSIVLVKRVGGPFYTSGFSHNRYLNDDHGQDEPVDPHAHSDDGDDAEDGNDIDTIRLVYILQEKGRSRMLNR